MSARLTALLWLLGFAQACAKPPASPSSQRARAPTPGSNAASKQPRHPPSLGPDAGRTAATQRPQPPAEPEVELPAGAEFVAVGRHWASLKRVCGLTPLAGSLYAAHAYAPLSIDGATVTRYTPDRTPAIEVAFDWNRQGQPSKGGGAGQGFIRLRAIDGRLYLPDADPPYVGFRLSGQGIEGYVFVSDARGRFARARHPKHLPPAPPTEERGGAAVLPQAYHVFDVAAYRGKIYASAGARDPTSGGAPGALYVAQAEGEPWRPVAYFPDPPGKHVWRLTYLASFRDRLYAGVETFDSADLTDYVTFEAGPAGQTVTSRSARAEQNAAPGGAATLRWHSEGERLYWIAAHRGGVTLQVSEDGVGWRVIELPPEAGRPLDLRRYRGALVILTEGGLFQLRRNELKQVAQVAVEASPFELTDAYCPAPLGVYGGQLYAGGQRKGRLYRLDWPTAGAGPADAQAAQKAR